MESEPAGEGRAAAWPTIEEQLAASKIIPGSALEKLIRENQDFHMLRPEEANDKLRLPMWLRVYWRKEHPEGRYFGPSGGYPLMLRECYEWMLDHQDLPHQKGGEVPGQPGGEAGRDGK